MSKKKINKTDWKEQRRFHALKLKKNGWNQSEIADALKVSKGSVSQWLSKAKAKGIQSLRIQSPPGRPPGLTEFRKQLIPDLLSHGVAKYIHLERLPAYAPDLNPDGGTWCHLKYVELANVCCTDLPDLHSQVSLAVSLLRLQSFIDQAGLPIRKNLLVFEKHL